MATTKKKISLALRGLDGNAFFLMGAFSRQAKSEGWTREEISAVLDEAKSGDYDNLLRVLMEHCESPDDEWVYRPSSATAATKRPD